MLLATETNALHASIDRALRAAKQDRARRSDRIVVILVGPERHPVPAVDPYTHQATGERQQFRLHTNGTTMTVLNPGQWVSDPEEYCVDYMSY